MAQATTSVAEAVWALLAVEVDLAAAMDLVAVVMALEAMVAVADTDPQEDEVDMVPSVADMLLERWVWLAVVVWVPNLVVDLASTAMMVIASPLIDRSTATPTTVILSTAVNLLAPNLLLLYPLSKDHTTVQLRWTAELAATLPATVMATIMRCHPQVALAT